MKVNFKILSVVFGLLSVVFGICCCKLAYSKTIQENRDDKFSHAENLQDSLIYNNKSFYVSYLQDSLIYDDNFSHAANIQDSLINSNEYYWGNDIVTNIKGKCIQGFIGWLRQWRKENYEIEVFNTPDVTYTVKINPDTTFSSQQDYIDKERAMYDEYAFSYYPTYQCCDIKSLIQDNKVLILVDFRMVDVGRTICDLTALIPDSDKNYKNSTTAKRYWNIRTLYCFGLEIKKRAGDRQRDIDSRIEDLSDGLKWYHRPATNDTRDKRSSFNIFNNLTWKLSYIEYFPHQSVTIDLNDLPTDIFKIF